MLFEDQVRVISYDSSRGWKLGALLYGFIDFKRNSKDTKYLTDDLFLSEEERKHKYELTWLLMAFTRPMNTLYLDLRKREPITVRPQ